MRANILSLTFLALLLVAAQTDGQGTKLKFSFYITSQCRDTINFITTKMYPTYQELGEYLDVEFVPWGKTRRNTDGSLTCQFGPTDCVANKIQSCVLFLLENDQAKQTEYINCEMSTLAAVNQDYSCANRVGISTALAQQCYQSSLGDELQAEAERKTGTIVMVFVPTIVYNDRYDAQIQNQAFSDFKGYVCSLLQNENVPACN